MRAGDSVTLLRMTQAGRVEEPACVTRTRGSIIPIGITPAWPNLATKRSQWGCLPVYATREVALHMLDYAVAAVVEEGGVPWDVDPVAFVR